MNRTFTLEYWKDKNWVVGKLKEVPGVFSQGKTLKELEKNIREAYKLMMEEMREDIPRRSVKTKEMGIAV